MYKAISRTQVDLTLAEQARAISALFSPSQAKGCDKVPEFERSFAGYIGSRHAVAFPSCRSAMLFTLKALKLEPGAEIILPAYTFWVDAAMVVLAGYTPVFADVDPETMLLSPETAKAVVTPKTRAIFPTHLNGLAADMDPIMELARKHDLFILEDCARSCGVSYKGKKTGSFGIGAFSFGYGKSFYDFGGGMVTSNDTDFVQQLRVLKRSFHQIGMKQLAVQVLKGSLLYWLNKPLIYPISLFPMAYDFQVKGGERFAPFFRIKMPNYEGIPSAFDVEMNNVQAELGLSQLKRIDTNNARRRNNLLFMNEQLQGVSGIMLPREWPERPHGGVHYPLWTEQKEKLQKFLMKNRIDAQNESAIDTTKFEPFARFASGKYPNAAKLDKKVLFLPTHHSLCRKTLTYIASKVREFHGSQAEPEGLEIRTVG